MITHKELQELVDFDTQGRNVLSLYLNTDLTQHLKEERRLALKQLLDGLPADGKAEAERAQEFFNHECDWQAQGIAIFSSTPIKFWREIRLAVPVLDYATIDTKPNVRLLTDLMDEYESCAVALVDRTHARFFVIQLGEITEFSRALPPPPGRHKQGGWSAARFQRHIEALALQNLKQAAQLTVDFLKSQDCSHLLLAGTDDTITQFRGLLPKAFQRRIVGEFPMDIHAPASLVLEKARAIEERVERAQELAQVEALNTGARKKKPTAVLGLADTLNALLEGKVLELIVASDYRAPGFACAHCGYLSAQALPTCPLCSHPMRQVDGIVDLAVRKAIELGSRVEMVRDPAAARLKESGAIGALLRY